MIFLQFVEIYTKIIKKALNLSRLYKQIILLITDVIVLELSIIFSYSLRQAEFYLPNLSEEKLILISPLIALPIFYFFGLYQSIVRFIGLKAFLYIIYAITTYMVIWSIFGYTLNVEVPHSVLIYHNNGEIYKVSEYFSGFFVLCIINWLICLLLIGISRLLIRQIYWGIAYGVHDINDERKNIIIYGAGSAGIQLANALYYSKELKPIAFIDDNNSLIGKEISSLKILSSSKINTVIKKYNVKEALIAIPSITNEQKEIILRKLRNFPIKVSTLPGISELAEGKVRIDDREPIRIEDILGRTPVLPNQQLMDYNTKKKNVLVTGAGGSIGSELCYQISKLKPASLILYEQNEFALYEIEKKIRNIKTNKKLKIFPILGDVCDKKKIKLIIKRFNVNSIYHAAAYKHVPMVEMNIIEAFKNNVLGTLSCASAASELKVENFILISTDKAVRPTNFMGATKRFSELIIQSFSSKSSTIFSAVRFGNVLGSSGSVIPLFEKQISKGGPITVTHKKVTRYFMTLKEAAQLVIQAGSIKGRGTIYVLDMGTPIKILDLAKKMLELSGFSWIDENDKNFIKIKITGLRPGEKMFEELSFDNNLKNTIHPKIMSIQEKNINENIIFRDLKKFKDINTTDNIKSTLLLVKSVIKDYKPIQKSVDNFFEE